MAEASEKSGFFRRSVRYRLLAIALVPMLVVLPVLLAIGIDRWNDRFDAVTIAKVNDDLTIARQYLSRILENTENRLVAIGESERFRQLLRAGNESDRAFPVYLEATAQRGGFDFLYVVADDGEILAGDKAATPATLRWDWPVVVSALAGRSRTAIDVFAGSELSALSPQLAERARVEIVPVVRDGAPGGLVETRGLVLQSAATLLLPDGRRAALVGGILLNRNLGFVDAINDLIYHGSTQPDGTQGTATLFLDDIRVSTNVRLFGDRRAIGTRVSEEVRSTVLDQGKTWLDSAFVVNDWYVSAYEPIVDSYGRRVGMLYAGFVEAPFAKAKHETWLTMGVAFLLAVLATVPLFLIWARTIFRPLERMKETIARVEDGDLAARTGAVENRDEIGLVASELDRLLDGIQTRDAELRLWNDQLSQRAEQRALELRDTAARLETTTRQLVMSEKLAAIGEITAGVAHEINNPIAVMQGNLEIIRDMMGPGAEEAKTEFRLINQQMNRITEIVTKLLQFAKPQEYAGFTEDYAPADVISDTLPLVQHLLKKTMITVEREDRALRLIRMSRTELQQVLVNLIVNAIHAMPRGGCLGLRTVDAAHGGVDGVEIEVSDTGAGMTPDVMGRIFASFFTTKSREGTGLGLSISQMLMSQHGGKITVRSEPGEGTTFKVWLPATEDDF
ncbi:cache domain-containing protein [Shinella yambaruensis]|uniref:histidine kinase n=1 Tax=Shinella yambaruensis TaxID=415996 RepID=A0ABQ5ZBE4_9HYPH|nr:HAMP domain-containing sensor histidine kinase [Shinella yambaruensis]MCJ8029679.1 cache domain-containing protein [Shinella yambaruensis]MCU7984408.1 cache domain-containing protein [Shinella yambaruensis]GLR50129.1 two-component sensor histidine kinase [Shinella yambaruensis]